MQITVTNISDELLTLKTPFSMGNFTASAWSRTALQPGESATAELSLLAPYDGGNVSFNHNLDPREFLVSVAFSVGDLIRVKDASDTIIIPNGDNTPSIADGTDFGNTNVNATVSKTYIIENVGVIPTAVSISVPSGYTLTSSPSGAILPGEQASFTVRFNALVSGDTGGAISISTGSSENYTFTITGHGNFYFEKARGGLIQYYFQNELVGTIANDDSPENNDGVYSGVTLNAIDSPIPGDRAPSFDGVNDYVALHSAGLQADFNASEGTVFLWAKVANAGVWTDGAGHQILRLAAADSTNNQIRILKNTTNNQLFFGMTNGGTAENFSLNGISTTDWFGIALTWNKAQDRVRAYLNGVLQGTQTGLGVWVGSLSSSFCLLGAQNTVTAFWSGYLSHYRLYNRELTAAEILELNTIP